MKENKRKNLRYEILLSCNARSDLDAEYTDLIMSNLSIGGCFIKSDQYFPEGSLIELEVFLPELEKKVKTKGKIIWNKKEGGRYAGFGVQFTELSKEDLNLLKKYIEYLVLEDLKRF